MRLNPQDVETNILFLELDPDEARLDAFALMHAMKERGVLAMAAGPYSMRLVTHLDVSRAQIEEAAQVICDVLG